jgi:anti-sigma factor RsiW
MDDDLSQILRQHRDELRHPLPESLRRKLNRQYAPRRPWALRSAAMLACACVALAVSFTLGRSSSQTLSGDLLAQELVGSHVRSLMANHLADVPSTDKHTVKPWFEGRLDFGPDVRDFPQEGFVLTGGRLDYVDSRNVAALVYRRGQHVINLFEWPTSSVSTEAPRLLTRRGFQLFVWQKSGLAYWAVSDLNAAELQQFAGLWQQ